MAFSASTAYHKIILQIFLQILQFYQLHLTLSSWARGEIPYLLACVNFEKIYQEVQEDRHFLLDKRITS
jgi:hypothetical protein